MIIAISFIALIEIIISVQSKLLWNIEEPYKYNGFIYTDSHSVVINPAIQVKIVNNEEICNFYVNTSALSNERLLPFRAVVKSAILGIGELELRPNISLDKWKGKEITFTIIAEACHDPDSWSVPATVSIKVLDPPGPLWTSKSYSVALKTNAPVGTTVIKVTAYVPKWTSIENKICQYLIKSPSESPFQIDGEGTIKTSADLTRSDTPHWTLIIAARDCSQPAHRESQVNVFVSLNPTCKVGWTGFYTLLKYKPGSGVKYISKNAGFKLCEDAKADMVDGAVDTTISDCMRNKTLRLTTSVELKYQSSISATDADLSDQSNCKLDYQSLRLQREVCGVPSPNALELLTELNKQRTGALLFPIEANIFPAASIAIENTLSFYFWLKRDQRMDSTDEYIVCQINDAGDNMFSVMLRKCVLRIQLRSYATVHDVNERTPDIPTTWSFDLPQLCDSKWHHIVVLATRSSENLSSSEMRVFIDGEMIEFKAGNPEILLESPLEPALSNMTDIFLGQCPKSEKTEYKGLLAGVIMTPGIVLKSSISRCLTKCSERLYFNGMNQMNPGMSVSLNSEMLMIIINGHSIDEVIRLVKVIGFVNPSWNPRPGNRELSIETEMSCGDRVFNVAPVKVVIRVQKQSSNRIIKDRLTLFSLVSTVSTIVIPDSTQANPDMGTGVAVFANTTLDMSGHPQSTNDKNYDVPWTISKCVVTIQPKLSHTEYLNWPRHLLEAVSADKYSIKVTNTSRTVLFYGLHNQQVYQFVVQHLRYFSSVTDDSIKQATRTFRLQCFSNDGQSRSVKSNVAVVKVIIWYNDYREHRETSTLKSTDDENVGDYSVSWKEIMNNITNVRNHVPLHAQSNAALVSEIDPSQKKSTSMIYNVLLSIGLLTLVTSIIMLIRKVRRNRAKEGCLVPYQIVDRICFPLQIIKEKIRPSPSVRVELSRDFINCVSERRRDVSMEMQWDDTELKSNNGFNIIANPMYETSLDGIDDISLNRDVPPACEDENSTTDDDDDDEEHTYDEEFAELYLERSKSKDKLKVK